MRLILALLFVALCFVAGDWPADPLTQRLDAIWQPPSRHHLLGTDGLGRDVLARVLSGGRLSLGLAVAGTLGAAVLGVPLGVLVARSGRMGEIMMLRATDVGLALPSLLLAGALASLFGPGRLTLVTALVLAGWPVFARLTWSVTLGEWSREYAAASLALGASPGHVVRVHVLPALVVTLSALMAVSTAQVLLSVATFSFLGFGVQPPTPEWGVMLAEGRSAFLSAPYLVLGPGIALVVVAAGLGALAELVEAVLRPGA